MSSESKTGVISSDSRLANEIYANMRNAAKDFSMEKVAKEMKRTARFLKDIGAALIEIDCTAAKDNAK